MRTQRDLLQDETGNQVRHMIQPQRGDVAGRGELKESRGEDGFSGESTKHLRKK